MKLRDYQEKGIGMLYRNIASGITDNIFWLQTGGGKSVVFSKVISDILSGGGYVPFVVKRRALIHQASTHFDRWGLDHGVYMANHPRYWPRKRLQVCSVDTLSSRSIYPHSDKDNSVLIIDECHDCSPKSRGYASMFESYANRPRIGFTATPFNDNSLWNGIIKPIEAHELMERGYLVPARTFVPNIIDTSNVSISKGDFNEQELFEASSRKKIVGDFIRDWRLYAQNRPTVLFAVNIEHSKIICRAFNDAGIKAAHVDASTVSSERKRILNSLASGSIKVATNVNVFSVGVDVPEIGAIQICRPTQSLIWHLQSIGRGLRPCPAIGKQDCIVIDNAGNTLRHGSVYRVREAELSGKITKKQSDEPDILVRRCEQCLAVYEAPKKECPECGHVNKKQERRIEQDTEGELTEYQMSEEELESLKKRSFISDFHKLTSVATRTSKITYKQKWVWHKLRDKYGIKTCKEYGKLVNLEY